MGRPPKRRGKGGGSRGRPPLHQRGEPSPPPDAQRCARNNGKFWRCQARTMPGYSFCEVHYEQDARWAAGAKALNARGRGGTARRGGGRGRPPSRVRVAEVSSEVEPPRAKKRGRPKKPPPVAVVEDSDEEVIKLIESFPQLKGKKIVRKDMDEKAKAEHSGADKKSFQEEKAPSLSVVDRTIEKVYKRKPRNTCPHCKDIGRVFYCYHCGVQRPWGLM